MKKKFIIEIDVINGTVDFENPDEMSVFEVLGAIEYVKVMVAQQVIEDDD